MTMQTKQGRTPELHLMGKTLEDMISFIEDFTGEKLTPEEIEELRQILANEGSSPAGQRPSSRRAGATQT